MEIRGEIRGGRKMAMEGLVCEMWRDEGMEVRMG